MKQYRIFKAIKILACIAIMALAVGYVTMHLWNWLMPAIFGLTTITWYQAIGLLVLGKLLFGGFHHHRGGHRGGRSGWKRHMQERWEGMSEEERERFRSGMRGRRGCGPFGRHREEPAETPVAR